MLIFSGTIASADEVRELAALGVAGYVNEYSAVQHILPSLAPHLFPDNFNRRSSPRVVLGIPIQYRFGNTIAAALTLNLSHGGIAIRTTSPLDGGAKIKVRFRMPGIEEGHRRRRARRVERPPRRHGHPVRDRRSRQPDDHRPLRRRALLQQQKSVRFRPMEHSLAATLWRLVGAVGAGLRQRVLRRRRVLDRHGAQDAHRSADRRRAPRRAGGAPRRHAIPTATSPPRSSASRWPASASAGSASRRSRRSFEPALDVPARASRRRDRAQHRGRDRVRDHHRAAHRVRRAGAEMIALERAGGDGAAGSSSRPSSSCRCSGRSSGC